MKALSWRLVSHALLPALFVFVAGFWAYVAYLSSKNESSCIANAEIPGIEKVSDLAAELQAVLDQYSQANNNVGLQGTVILPGGEQWNGTSGYANESKACQMTMSHDLYIGNITKTFTAAMIMAQVEAEKLGLDDPIAPWVQHSDGHRITVEMLMHHTSGIPSYTEDPAFLLAYFGKPQKQWSPDELMRVVANKALIFEPGFQHEYSNSNFLILGIILETVAKKTYGELLQESIAQMDLERVYYPVFSRDLKLANGYDETLLNLGKRDLTAFRTSFESGAFSAGGIAGSSQDVALFFHSLFKREWLENETVTRMMNTIEAPDKDLPLQRGYGLGIRKLGIDGEMVYGHTGTLPGYSGIAMHNPERDFTIVVLSNVSTVEQTTLFADLQKVILNHFG